MGTIKKIKLLVTDFIRKSYKSKVLLKKMELFIKKENCIYDELFLLTGASWEAEEELEKENIKVVVQSNDLQNNIQLELDNHENVNPVVNAYKCTAYLREFTQKSDFDRHM